jgi:GR25 family glycosyltransferase involved in LPS biosynthesis
MVDFEYIDVFIICTPSSNRVVPLLEVLKESKILRPKILEATMYSRQQQNLEVDFQGQKALYGHELSDGAIGCAISHQNAMQKVIELGKGAIILEDDARIPNLEKLEAMVSHFFLSFSSKKYVLSLLPWNHKENCLENDLVTKEFFRLRGKTPLTVGYALTLDAAKELSASNPLFKFAADWPPNSATYLSSLTGVINHGDGQSGSVIQHPSREKGLNRFKKLHRVIFFDYWRFRQEFSSFSEYVSLKITPSFTWRIDDLRAKSKATKLRG